MEVWNPVRQISHTHNTDLRGSLPNFITDFLKSRGFKVLLGILFSDHFDHKMGVPQQGIHFPALNSATLSATSRVELSVFSTWTTFSMPMRRSPCQL